MAWTKFKTQMGMGVEGTLFFLSGLWWPISWKLSLVTLVFAVSFGMFVGNGIKKVQNA